MQCPSKLKSVSRCEHIVSTNVLVAGTVKLEINQNDGLRLWIDGAPIKDLEAAVKLARGRHTLTIALDRRSRRVGLRVELKSADDVVRFKPEGGP